MAGLATLCAHIIAAFCLIFACNFALVNGGFGGKSFGGSSGRSSGGFFGRSSGSKASAPAFSGSYPRQSGINNPPSYASATGHASPSGAGGYSRGTYGGAGATPYTHGGGAYVGSASHFGGAQEAQKRISGGDMLKIGAGVAGGVVVGSAVSHALFSPHYSGAYYTDSNRYFYDPQRDRYYDAKRQYYSADPPCIKPNKTANAVATSTANTTVVLTPDNSTTTMTPTLLINGTTMLPTVATNVTVADNQTKELMINGTMPAPEDQWKMYAECLEYFVENKKRLAAHYRAARPNSAPALSINIFTSLSMLTALTVGTRYLASV